MTWTGITLGRIDLGPDRTRLRTERLFPTTPVYMQLVSCNFHDCIFCSNCHVMIDSSLYSYLTDIFASDHVYSTFLQFKTLVLTYTKIGVEDVQSTILLCLLVWLLINIVLIKITWTLYGQHICQKFLRQGLFLLYFFKVKKESSHTLKIVITQHISTGSRQ